MNDTVGENGLVPSRLVLGIIPRFPILNSELPDQKEILEIIKNAQAEMNSIDAERRVLSALTRNVPACLLSLNSFLLRTWRGERWRYERVRSHRTRAAQLPITSPPTFFFIFFDIDVPSP